MLKSQIPVKWQEAWAKNAPGANIRAIPLTTATPGFASQDQGFTTINATPVGAGGIPPFFQDVNGVLNVETAWSQWMAAGGAIVPWDATFSTTIGGYPQGAIVASTVTAGLYFVSTVDNNTTNPDSSVPPPAGWLWFYLPRKQPTFIRRLSGSGNVTPSAGVVAWRVRMVAGGGGGGFLTGGNGAAGTASSLVSTTVNPGQGGQNGGGAGGPPGAGGTGGTTGTGTEIARFPGASGNIGPVFQSAVSGAFVAFTPPGSSAIGLGGGATLANSGMGGRADGTLSVAATQATAPGSGGGGEYVEFIMSVVFGTNYAFVVGTGGASGGGSSQAGSSGGIWIEEIYP